MATTPNSTIIGRTVCPECGFESAHVKQSEKCIFRFCPKTGLDDEPGCGAMYHATTPRQKRELLAKTRLTTPTQASPSPSPTPREAVPVPTPTPTQPSPTPTPEAPKKRIGFFTS